MNIELYLKPCPFCGHEVSTTTIQYEGRADIVTAMEVMCNRCGIKFEIHECHRTIKNCGYPEDAINIWNRRAKEENMTDKFVDFYTYCKACKHKDKNENDDPCNDCLNEPVNEDSHKPWYFEEAKDE